MTKKSLSNGWVVNLKDSYLFQTFSFEIFFWQISQQKSVNRVDATEILKNGNSFKKQIQNIGKHYYFQSNK